MDNSTEPTRRALSERFTVAVAALASAQHKEGAAWATLPTAQPDYALLIRDTLVKSDNVHALIDELKQLETRPAVASAAEQLGLHRQSLEYIMHKRGLWK